MDKTVTTGLRIDAHQHFWRYVPAEFPWIGAGMDVLARDHGPADLQPLLRAHGFDASLAVQARPLAAETDWLLSLAASQAAAPVGIAGVVGWADLASPGLADQLAAWRARGPLVGIRELVQDAPDPAALLADAAFNRGVTDVQRAGLVYDVLITSRHLDAAIDFCARHDRHWLVLDHLGKPDIRGDEWVAWGRRLQTLASMPHVVCKLSGLVTEAPWDGWSEATLAGYGELALDAFGADRVMFGSDWPVCTLAASYAQVVGIAEASLAGASAAERAAVFGGTAQRCYGLPTPSSAEPA